VNTISGARWASAALGAPKNPTRRIPRLTEIGPARRAYRQLGGWPGIWVSASRRATRCPVSDGPAGCLPVLTRSLGDIPAPSRPLKPPLFDLERIDLQTGAHLVFARQHKRTASVFRHPSLFRQPGDLRCGPGVVSPPASEPLMRGLASFPARRGRRDDRCSGLTHACEAACYAVRIRHPQFDR
jgi:hypothetical protein